MAAQKVRSRLGRPGRRRRRGEHVPRADRLRRRRLGAGPGDQLRHRLRAAGHRRRPDRHARRLQRARTSTRSRSRRSSARPQAREGGFFAGSIVPVEGRPRTSRSSTRTSSSSRAPRMEGLASLKPAFDQLGAMGFDAVAHQPLPAGRAHPPRAPRRQLVGHRRRRGGGADRQRGRPARRTASRRARASSRRRCRAPTRPSCSPARCRRRARRWPRPG